MQAHKSAVALGFCTTIAPTSSPTPGPSPAPSPQTLEPSPVPTPSPSRRPSMPPVARPVTVTGAPTRASVAPTVVLGQTPPPTAQTAPPTLVADDDAGTCAFMRGRTECSGRGQCSVPGGCQCAQSSRFGPRVHPACDDGCKIAGSCVCAEEWAGSACDVPMRVVVVGDVHASPEAASKVFHRLRLGCVVPAHTTLARTAQTRTNP